MSEIPEDIRSALLKTAKAWLLNNYIGGVKQLAQWSDHYASLTSIHSVSLPGCPIKNLRRLVKLSESGVLTERPRYRNTGVRTFTAPPQLLDEIGKQAVAEWEAAGYRVGEMMYEIKGVAP
jgi:hypothetical protein